ncbi:MAG: hypothetical protein M1832_001557 [Thelocarpon impressellum]|nr:MAG: hypothetical protein M1832_001557 [Thelocarpon impressellum]
MPDGPGCDANGFIGQLSVQATDLTILMIAVVTLIGIRQVVVIPDPSFRAKLILCTSIWVIPIITASIALSSDYFVPVKGNWCWIKERPSYLRYVLTHMWRFATIVFSTIIYIHIYIYLHKHFKRMPRSFYRSSHDDEDHTHDLHIALDQGHSQQSIVRAEQGELGETGYNTASSTAAPGLPLEPGAYEPKKEGKHGLHAHGDPIAAKEAMIKKTLLLNAYPIMYILLWLPGIANRIAEATGRPTVVLQILQASTQYVGLANAVTYGLNEQVIRQLRQFYGRPDARRRR